MIEFLQMQVASPFPPAKFLDEDIINAYKNDYMFISCIDFIQQVGSNMIHYYITIPFFNKFPIYR